MATHSPRVSVSQVNSVYRAPVCTAWCGGLRGNPASGKLTIQSQRGRRLQTPLQQEAGPWPCGRAGRATSCKAKGHRFLSRNISVSFSLLSPLSKHK